SVCLYIDYLQTFVYREANRLSSAISLGAISTVVFAGIGYECKKLPVHFLPGKQMMPADKFSIHWQEESRLVGISKTSIVRANYQDAVIIVQGDGIEAS